MSKKALKGTKTIENLMKAFAGESQARNRYTMYAGVASKEGHVGIENVFLLTAENERLHAKEFYKFILEGAEAGEALTVHVDADYPVALGTTEQNLAWAAAGEHEEANDLYLKFADVADQEGFKDIAFKFRTIGKIEEHHEQRYLSYAKMLKDGTLYKKDATVSWMCRKCGYIHTDMSAPEVCPVCAHPKGYFELVK
jgi:rubrerythrin